jgi:hypothetical protein
MAKGSRATIGAGAAVLFPPQHTLARERERAPNRSRPIYQPYGVSRNQFQNSPNFRLECAYITRILDDCAMAEFRD